MFSSNWNHFYNKQHKIEDVLSGTNVCLSLSLQKREMFHFLQVVMIVSRSVILNGIIQVHFVLIAANWNVDKNVSDAW